MQKLTALKDDPIRPAIMKKDRDSVRSGAPEPAFSLGTSGALGPSRDGLAIGK